MKSLRCFSGLLIAAALVFSLLGCERDDSIEAYPAPKDRPVASASPTMAASAPLPVQWAVPTEWKPAPLVQFSVATFKVSSESSSPVVTVSPLMGNSDPSAHVNRWERQIGLPPTPANELANVVKSIDVNGVTMQSVDLIGPESAQPRQRILAVLAPRSGQTWFFKMNGPADQVAAHVNEFNDFVRSMKFADAVAKAPSAPAPPSPPMEMATPPKSQSPEMKWTAPQGWIQDAPKIMRVASFKTSKDAGAAAEVIITRFGAGMYEAKLDNINRWRGMIELPQLDDATKQPVEKTKVADRDAEKFEFANAGTKMIVIAIPRDAEVGFIRFVGPAKAVDAEQKNFDAFVKSFQW